MNFPLNQIILGDCCEAMAVLAPGSVDFVLTDPPYLVGYRDRTGRSLQGDTDSAWLKPAFRQAFRLLRNDSLCVSFYGWTRTDLFFDAWKAAGFRGAGPVRRVGLGVPGGPSRRPAVPRHRDRSGVSPPGHRSAVELLRSWCSVR